MSRARPASVAQVMRRLVLTVPTTMPAADALALLRRDGVRHAVVMDGGVVAGVVSERDLTGVQARILTRWLVHDVMSARPVVVAPETAISEAAHVLRSRRIGCLPVVRGSALVGIVTRSDLLRLLETGPVADTPPVRCRWPVTERRPRASA